MLFKFCFVFILKKGFVSLCELFWFFMKEQKLKLVFLLCPFSSG